MISDIATLSETILELIHFSSKCMHNTLRRTEVLITLLQQPLKKHITLVTGKAVSRYAPLKVSSLPQQIINILRVGDRFERPAQITADTVPAFTTTQSTINNTFRITVPIHKP